MNRRARVVRALATVVYRSGLLRPMAAVAARLRRTVSVPVLTFHRVNDDQDPFFAAMATSVFAARMEHIARHYTVLPVEELAERLREGRAPANGLALTFDDGYRDSLTHAAPILARHGLPATIFLTTGYVGTSETPWYDLLALGLKTTRRGAVSLVPGQSLPLGSTPERLRALEAALRYMKRLPDTERRGLVDRLIRDLDPVTPEGQKRLMLSWDEVDALRGLGFSIGAHTVNHPILSTVEPAAAWDEIHGSKATIEKKLGMPVRGFAYPNGGVDDYTAETVGMVERAGFRCAVTTRRGLNTERTSLFELRRGGPWEQHLPTFAMKLAYYQVAGI
jgi:peptidoglycan/xylan/chitin deacetylase (PgdA/CDA1 family)